MGSNMTPKLVVACLIFFLCVVSTLAEYDTEKKVWVMPAPSKLSIGEETLWLDEWTFNIRAGPSSPSNDILKKSFTRFGSQITGNKGSMRIIDFPYEIVAPPADFSKQLKAVTVYIQDPTMELKDNTDESYSLVVNSKDGAVVKAQTVFGAMHGLQTFSQLVHWNGTLFNVPYTPISIEDAPYWSWRGMLIDTSRHFLPVKDLYKVIDSLALAKYNVFHWHLVDAESFPIVLPSVPEFAKYGAYDSKKAVYTQKDVAAVIKYALYRGLRVLPEIDTPGHTYAMGKSHPEMIVDCTKMITKRGYPGINNVPLNVTNPDVYPLLEKIYKDIANAFPMEWIHVGGDEVAFSCFREFHDYFNTWMLNQGMDNSTYHPMIQYFREKLSAILKPTGKGMIVWQEALEEMLHVPNNPLEPSNTIVHIWINNGYKEVIEQSVKLGYRTLLSSGWYLDQQIPNPNETDPNQDRWTWGHYLSIDTWEDMYKINPLAGLNLTEEEASLFIGGEAAQWGEAIFPTTLLTNIWPRAAAIADRLWVGPHATYDISSVYHRLVRYGCWLYQNQVPVSGLRPNYCTSSYIDPPFKAGGMKVDMPVWSIVLLCVIICVLLIALIALIVAYYQLANANKKTDTYEQF